MNIFRYTGIQGSFLWSFIEIGPVIYYEEIMFEDFFDGHTDTLTHGQTTDKRRLQKLTLSLFDRWANKKEPLYGVLENVKH